MTRVAVASISARVLAEAARADGVEVLALDLFGDADTRRASAGWQPIGAPGGSLQVDADLLVAALATARRDGATAWVVGSGFDGRPDLLQAGAELLPLIGNGADVVRRVRDPAAFFSALDAAGIGHPALQFTVPDEPAGWLFKDPGGCGGWHIRRADALAACAAEQAAAPAAPPAPRAPRAPPASGPPQPALGAAPAAQLSAGHYPPTHYFQREIAGVPMSATFIADGHGARLLGCNLLLVRAVGDRPFVYCGAVGPVALPAEVAQRVSQALQAVAGAFALRGLGSLDFIRCGHEIAVLEINPRPPASMALYADRHWGSDRHGIFAAHLHGSRGQPWLAPDAPAPREAVVHGTEIVFARGEAALDAAAVQRLDRFEGCHDRPAAPLVLRAGDPVCSVSACGPDAAHVSARLEHRREAVHLWLETLT